MLAICLRRGSRTLLALIIASAVLQPTVGGAQQTARVQKLFEKFNAAYAAKDFSHAIEVGVEIDRLVPERPVHQYNLACVSALVGDADAAVEWLGRAAAHGFDQVAHLAADPDLAAVREHQAFLGILAAVRRNEELVRDAVRQAFDATPPLVFPPPDHDAKEPAPLLIALHGNGGRSDGYPSFWKNTAHRFGAILVAPQGVRPVGQGFSWHRPEEAELILELTLDWLWRSYAVDEGQIVLTGFSQGGFMAMALGLRRPELFAGVIPMAGGIIPEVDSPPNPPGESAPRYYFMVGSRDRAKEPTRQAAADFSAAGYEVELRVLPGTGHDFPRNTDRELSKALRFVLVE